MSTWVIDERPDFVRVRMPCAWGLACVGMVVAAPILAVCEAARSAGDVGGVVVVAFWIACFCVSGYVLWRYARDLLVICDEEPPGVGRGLGRRIGANDIECVVLQYMPSRDAATVRKPTGGQYAWIWHTRIRIRGEPELLTIHCDPKPRRQSREKAIAEKLAARWRVPIEIER